MTIPSGFSAIRYFEPAEDEEIPPVYTDGKYCLTCGWRMQHVCHCPEEARSRAAQIGTCGHCHSGALVWCPPKELSGKQRACRRSNAEMDMVYALKAIRKRYSSD